MNKILAAAAALAAWLAVPAASQEPGAEERAGWSAEQWRAAAERDVLAAYGAFVENHPGIYDLANPGFPADLARARAAGLEAARGAADASGYAHALGQFSVVLSDGHAAARPVLPEPSAASAPLWPGFAAVWRGERLLAVFPDAAAPLHGAEIVACDGEPIRVFLESALLSRGFRPREEGQWWSRAPQAFFATRELAADLPGRCLLNRADGAGEELALEWREASESERLFQGEAVQGDALPTGFGEPRPGIFHIALPTFHPDEQGRAVYRALFEEVAARRTELKSARALLIDLRRNGGGSSEWAYRLAELLWGAEALAARDPHGVTVHWRASAENTAYIAEAAEEMIAQGRHEFGEGWRQLAVELAAARARGEPLFDESRLAGAESEAKSPEGSMAASDFEAPVYVITHGGCASACLDAIDYFKRFANTQLIGAPTSADSTYMDVRRETLPSGAGYLVIPNKVWVGRHRGWGEIYRPDIAMESLDWSTAAFLDRIEQDRAAARPAD